jgi:peroxiredoxin
VRTAPSRAALAWTAAAICLGLACSEPRSSGAAGADVAAEGAEEARVAPDFALQSLDGETVRLSDLRGKTVVIDFWATWCPPCEFQVPELNAFWQAHKEDGDVEVLGISVDVDGPDVVQTWAGEKDVRYKVLVGGEDLARRFGALGFPTLYVIAPDGRVDSEHVGLIEVGDLETALARQRGGGAEGGEGSEGEGGEEG